MADLKKYPATRNQKAMNYIARNEESKNALSMEIEKAKLAFFQNGGVIEKVTAPENTHPSSSLKILEEEVLLGVISAKQNTDFQTTNELIESYRGLTDLQ